MDKVLSTVLLVVAAVVTVVMVINAVYPAVGESASALSSVSAKAADRVKSQFQIIHATGELDKNGNWQDINLDGNFDLYIWAKNTGTITIDDIKNADVFIGHDGSWERINYYDYAGGSFPYWSYTIENGTAWTQAGTLKIEVSYASSLTTGEYKIKLIIPNGISDEFEFSL